MWDPQRRWGAVFAAVDGSFDRIFDRYRGRRGPDAVAAALSNLSDYGVVWPLVAVAKARRPGRRWRTVAALGAAGTSSWLVNKLLKAVFRRQRPGAVDDAVGRRPAVRPPTSSSFPSGHTLASFCTAVVLADGPGEAAAFLGFASGVAVSRLHLRAHHATDVLAGAGVGLTLGLVVRGALRRCRPLGGPTRAPLARRE
jgi:membrane-associated phospholipid phosphatase